LVGGFSLEVEELEELEEVKEVQAEDADADASAIAKDWAGLLRSGMLSQTL
jgi:hypothetical protein